MIHEAELCLSLNYFSITCEVIISLMGNKKQRTKLLKKIEALRDELNALFDEKGCLKDPEVIKKSKELEKKLIEYIKLGEAISKRLEKLQELEESQEDSD